MPWEKDRRFLWAVLLLVIVSASSAWANPYEGVDWKHTGRHKANLHTHTTQSDGRLKPDAVIDEYHKRGYTILALTDHNRCTFPWRKFGREPAELGMVAIAGNELSLHHHTGALFVEYKTLSINIRANLAEVGEKGGVAILYHPGRYEKKHKTDWYIALLREYPHLLGLEVHNQGDRYPQDRELWDAVLTELMPERRVWGFSNDDMHRPTQLGRNWQVILVRDLNESNVREAIENGRFYFCYSHHDGEPVPVIRSIFKDSTRGCIAISATGADEMVWISRGKEVQSGPIFDPELATDAAVYVRACLKGPTGVTYTQPFSLPSEDEWTTFCSTRNTGVRPSSR